ncbi:TorF family putative porin [uncultured Maricaulis sp.]|uniref:TorF family putative porin n=1 Tax=uncultured Maricaulis sp. TaxID=174710 RepID=UPI0030DBBEB9
MFKLKLFAAGALCLAGLQTASAQEVSGNITLATDYVFRGVSQTDHGTAIQGGFDVGSDSVYAGAWGTNVDFGDGTNTELDFYAGYTPSAGGFDFDFGGILYAYPGSPDTAGEQDFLEAFAGISRGYGSFDWDAKLSWSPDFYLESGPAWYAEFGASYQLAENFAVDAHLGLSRFDDLPGDDYEDYQIGASTTQFGVDWDLRWYDSQLDEGFVLSVSQSFGG